jgi:hypothetical protein
LLVAACAGGEPCPPEGALEHARAIDETHVELAFRCDVDLSVDDLAIETFARGPDGRLAVSGVSGGRTVIVETAPQEALVAYVARVETSRLTASANFIGVGDVPTAPVRLRLDDRYDRKLQRAFALVTFDPETGVFTHYSARIELLDPDGDQVFEADARVAVDPLRTVNKADDRLGAERIAYAARAVDAAGGPLSSLVTFEVRTDAASDVEMPLLGRPRPPGPEGLVTLHVKVDDRPARALGAPSLRVSAGPDGSFDAAFPTSVVLSDEDGDRIWEAEARVRIDPARKKGGTTSETYPYVLFVTDGGADHPGLSADVEATDEGEQQVAIRVGDPALVPVTFRVDVAAAYVDAAGTRRGVGPGEAVFLTGEFGVAEDAFGANASDAFSGGENVVLQMRSRDDLPGVWERTIFLPPARTYGWKVVRCPSGRGCAELNRRVTSSGRAFATVMKNLATENRDGQTAAEVRAVDPRHPTVTWPGGATIDFANAQVFRGAGMGSEPDPEGTPDAAWLFKQELPDLVVDVSAGAERVETPVFVVGTWRDVNLGKSIAEILAGTGVFDLNPSDYDAGFVGLAAPSYVLAAPPPPPPPPPFVIGDGMIDAGAADVPGRGASSMRLLWARSGKWLYVATDDAGEGSDHFLFVSAAAPGAPRPAPWAKAGTVAFPASGLVLVDENENDFAGWFALDGEVLLEAAGADTRGDLACATGNGVMEGLVDLEALFGAVPQAIYLAVGPWGTANAGPLFSAGQAPASTNGDGNLDAAEIAGLPLP